MYINIIDFVKRLQRELHVTAYITGVIGQVQVMHNGHEICLVMLPRGSDGEEPFRIVKEAVDKYWARKAAYLYCGGDS